MDFERRMELYAELTVKVALNVQPGQRLLIIGPLANGGAALEAAPVIRKIAECAYDVGAVFVEAIYGDEALQLVRFKRAPRNSFGQYSAWLPKALQEHVEGGNAVLSVYANDPDLLKHQPPELVSTVQEATAREVRPFREQISRNQTNWAVVAAASPGWATRVFPNMSEEAATARLWASIAASGSGTATHYSQIWQNIARDVSQERGLSLVETARLFALMNVSIHDALQTTLTSKFVYGLWRPVTAIRQADTDLNPATEPDTTWSTLIPTPPYPSYAGNMATIGASAARVIALAIGTNDVAVHATWKQSGGQPDVTHAFNTLSDGLRSAMDVKS